MQTELWEALSGEVRAAVYGGQESYFSNGSPNELDAALAPLLH